MSVEIMRMISRIVVAFVVVASSLLGAASFAQVNETPSQTIRVKVTEPGQSATSRALNIAQNKTAILEFEEDVDDILVANPEIADVLARSKRRIAVLAKGKGESSIIFTNVDGEEILALDVIVAGQGVSELQALLEQYVPRSSVKAEFVNGAIVLAGKAPSLSDADMAIQLAQQFVVDESPVINMISIEGKDQVLLKVRIVEMQRSVIKQLGVNLSGSLSVGELAKKVVQTPYDAAGLPLLDAFGNVIENAFLPGAPWDQSVTFGTSNSLGISGEALGGLSFKPSYNNFVGDKLQSSAGFSVDMLERIGLVRTLAEPNLTALSGESAKFLAGGEFPVPAEVDDDGEVVIEFKPFGVGLGFTPVVLSESRISMRISTEVSELTNQGGYQVGGGVTVDAQGNTISLPAVVIPALKVRRADTTVEMPSGGSLVIAGLIQEQTQQAMDKVPGVGNLPVLGSLFRSREFKNDETELVVIVTPYLVDPTDPKKLRSPDDGLVSVRDSKAIFFGKMNEVYGVEGADVDEMAGTNGAGFIFD